MGQQPGREAAVDRSNRRRHLHDPLAAPAAQLRSTWRITLNRAGTYSASRIRPRRGAASSCRSPDRWHRRVDHRLARQMLGQRLRTGRAGVGGDTAAGVCCAALASNSSTISSSCSILAQSCSEERPNCIRRNRASSSLSRSIQVRRYTAPLSGLQFLLSGVQRVVATLQSRLEIDNESAQCSDVVRECFRCRCAHA